MWQSCLWWCCLHIWHVKCRAVSEYILDQCLNKLALKSLAVLLKSGGKGGIQRQAYLGYNEALLEHMRQNSITTITSKRVRSWLEENGSFLVGYQKENLTLAECDIDHILPTSVGGSRPSLQLFLVAAKAQHQLGRILDPRQKSLLGQGGVKNSKKLLHMGKARRPETSFELQQLSPAAVLHVICGYVPNSLFVHCIAVSAQAKQLLIHGKTIRWLLCEQLNHACQTTWHRGCDVCALIVSILSPAIQIQFAVTVKFALSALVLAKWCHLSFICMHDTGILVFMRLYLSLPFTFKVAVCMCNARYATDSRLLQSKCNR